MDFEVICRVRNIETIATGRFGSSDGCTGGMARAGGGSGKGLAAIRLQDGTVHAAEVHWYEAHGIGRREMKIKFPLLD